MDEPADVVRRVVRQWSDAQLRRAWRTSGHGLAGAGPTQLARTSDVRRVLLEEWERRHPREPWDPHEETGPGEMPTT